MLEKTILFALLIVAALSISSEAATTAIDLGLYACTPQSAAEGSICKTQPDYSGAVCDASAGRCYVFGGGHSATYRDDVDVFDFATMAWSTPSGPSTPCADMVIGNLDRVQGRWLTTNHPVAQHTYDLRAWLPDGRIISMSRVQGRGAGCNNLPPISTTYPSVISASTINYYAPATGAWAFTNVPALDYNSAIELDPLSGKVLIASNKGLWLYDIATDTKTQALSFSSPAMGWSASLVYAPINDKFYWMGYNGNTGYSRAIFEITLNRATPAASTITNTGAVLPAPSRSCCSAGWAYDSAHNVIGGGVDNSTLYTFDPVTHVVAAQQLIANDGLIIDPMHGYVIGYGAGGYMFRSRPVSGDAFRTWLVPQP